MQYISTSNFTQIFCNISNISYGSLWKPWPIWGHRTLPRSSRRLWRIKVCVDQLSGPMAISPGNFREFATLPRKSDMINFFWPFFCHFSEAKNELPEVNPTLADGKLSPKFTTWRWRSPWVTFYTSQKGLTSN